MTSTNHNSRKDSLSTEAEIARQISEYFSKRGNFLAQVIRADLKSLPVSFFATEIAPSGSRNGNGHSNGRSSGNEHSNGNGKNNLGSYPVAIFHQTTSTVTDLTAAVTPTALVTELPTQSQVVTSSGMVPASIESLLVQGVMELTGYPVDSIALNAKLLDDLNLDSIKAGELVASVAKTCGVQGTLDPSALANATLSDIADAMRSRQQELGIDPAPSVTSGLITPESSPLQPAQGMNHAQISEQLLDLIVVQTGFPKESLTMELRLLDDLNLDSIKAAEVVGAIAKQIGVKGILDPSALANATLAEVVEALAKIQAPAPELKSAGSGQSSPQHLATPVQETSPQSWVRNFGVESVIQPYVAEQPENWSDATVLVVCDRLDRSFGQELQHHLSQFGAVVRVCADDELDTLTSTAAFTHAIAILPRPEDCPTELPLVSMVQRLRSIATLPTSQQPSCITYVQFGGGQFGESLPDDSPATSCAAAFARSLHLEKPQIRVRVIDLAPQTEAWLAVIQVVQEMAGKSSIVTAGYDAAGIRRVPQSRLQQPTQYSPRAITWSRDDVVLVTGGAKGITAECALAIAQTTGVKMALVGRSSATTLGEELTQTLAQFEAQGLICRYYACDIANAQSVAELVAMISVELGPITGVVHGAGLNTPRRIEQVSFEEAVAEVSPKLLGAYHLLDSIAPAQLKLFLAFSSIIGITGMPGNTWYAFANESLHLLLNQYQAKHPTTETISLAYSVWGEVGMGARMGSIKNLAKMGIGAISTEEGVQRCVRLFTHDSGTSQVAIAARLGGLDTWHPVPLIPTEDLRFIETICSIEPGVEIVARSHLTLERDRYVQDHIWRGSYLFPTVFGLEAMAQAIACVTGTPQPSFVRIENISLRRPIVVNPASGAVIEIHALVDEIDSAGEQRITVGIRTEQTGFKTDHFKAEFILGERPTTTQVSLELPDAIALDPKVDLYNQGGLLFQGALFQKLDQVYSLSRDYSLLKSHAQSADELNNTGFSPETDNRFVLGDPYFRDVLLQCMQVNIPQDICLPVQIDRLAINQNPAELSGAQIIQAILNFKEGREYHCEVVAIDQNGVVVEHLQGYRLRILEEHPGNPTALELADPQPRDSAILDQRIQQVFADLGLGGTTVKLAYAPSLGTLPKPERRQQETPLVEDTLRGYLTLLEGETLEIELDSHASGKPFLKGAPAADLELSLSHDDHYCICSLGASPQGCDIEAIQPRTQEDWRALIGNERFALVEELMIKGDTLEHAAMRVWSAVEAAWKAVEGVTPHFKMTRRKGDAVLLEMESDGTFYHFITFPVQLTRNPERMVAIAVTQTHPPACNLPVHNALTRDSLQPYDLDEMIVPQSNSLMITENGPNGQLVYERRFPVAFKEACSISRRVNVAQFIKWVGEHRELPLHCIGHQMLENFLCGDWGFVTNEVSLKLVGELTSYDTLQVRVWLDSFVETTSLTYIEFCNVLADNTLERVAIAEVKATWVQLKSYGIPVPSPFPDYVKEFLIQMAPTESGALDMKQAYPLSKPTLPQSLSHLEAGELIYQVPPEVNHYGDLLLTESFQTTLEESNVVGNVYYGNYFTWQGRMLDLFVYKTAPDYMRVSVAKGEILPLYSHMTYLKEAMPFDKIQVRLYVKSVRACGADFVFEYFREYPNGTTEKLQTGDQSVLWVVREDGNDGQPIPAPWPASILKHLFKSKESVPALSMV